MWPAAVLNQLITPANSLAAPGPSHKIRVWYAPYHQDVLEEFNYVTKMAVTEVPCLNIDKDLKVADTGFALTQVHKIHVSENQTRIRVFHISTKVKGPSQNNKSLYFLTHKFLSLLQSILNHFCLTYRHKYSLIKHGAF